VIEGLRGFQLVLHRHECKTSRFSGRAIFHEIDFSHGAIFRERILEIFLGQIESEISDKESVVHCIDVDTRVQS